MITSDQLTTQKLKFQTVVLLSAGVGVQFPYRMILYWFSWYRGALNSIQDGLLQVFADKGIPKKSYLQSESALCIPK